MLKNSVLLASIAIVVPACSAARVPEDRSLVSAGDSSFETMSTPARVLA